MFVNTRITICGLLVGASAAMSIPALTASAAAPAPTATASVASQTYTVVRGDTLSKIAGRFHTTVGRLVDLNKGRYPSLARNAHRISVGWVLKVDGAPSTPPASAPKPAPAPGSTTPAPVAPTGQTYTVKRGDTMSKIAKRFHTTVARLVDLNKGRYPQLAKNTRLIHVGWVLTVG
jgi:LysM repeat protein